MKIVSRLLPLLLLTSTIGCSGEATDDEPIVIQLGGEIEPGEDTNVVEQDMGSVDDARPDLGAPSADMQMEEDVAPDLPPEITGTTCQTKDVPIQLINTCMFEWSACDDGVEYGFRCDIQNVAGNVFSLCNCFRNGVKDEADKIVDVCGAADWSSVEAIVNEECGWDLR